jgi:phosphatidate cytidylyltransferase
MLKQRIITALILAPLALWAILVLSPETFRAALMVIGAMAGWEWARLVGWEKPAARAGYVVLLLALMLVIELLLRSEHDMSFLLYAALLWWLTSLLMIVRYPAGSGLWRDSHLARAMAGIIVILPMWLALGLLHSEVGPRYVVILALLVWGADTGAYFAGRQWGRHKLAPHVSPGKTWEGVAGAALMTLLVGAISGWLVEPAKGAFAFVLLALITIAFSIIGDLQESMFKRIVDLKDSGGLLPGHGGVLDRIDSLTAAAPIFALGAAWLNS